MDDPNDFEWGFPKAKNRASNGTLYDTHHVSQVIEARNVVKVTYFCLDADLPSQMHLQLIVVEI
jgi:hypothetical protein